MTEDPTTPPPPPPSDLPADSPIRGLSSQVVPYLTEALDARLSGLEQQEHIMITVARTAEAFRRLYPKQYPFTYALQKQTRAHVRALQTAMPADFGTDKAASSQERQHYPYIARCLNGITLDIVQSGEIECKCLFAWIINDRISFKDEIEHSRMKTDLYAVRVTLDVLKEEAAGTRTAVYKSILWSDILSWDEFKPGAFCPNAGTPLRVGSLQQSLRYQYVQAAHHPFTPSFLNLQMFRNGFWVLHHNTDRGSETPFIKWEDGVLDLLAFLAFHLSPMYTSKSDGFMPAPHSQLKYATELTTTVPPGCLGGVHYIILGNWKVFLVAVSQGFGCKASFFIAISMNDPTNFKIVKSEWTALWRNPEEFVLRDIQAPRATPGVVTWVEDLDYSTKPPQPSQNEHPFHAYMTKFTYHRKLCLMPMGYYGQSIAFSTNAIDFLKTMFDVNESKSISSQ